MNVLRLAGASLFALSLVACGDSGGSVDMGHADTGTGTDLGGGTDAGGDTGTGTDAGSDSGTGTDAGADVAACEASVDAVHAACVAEDPTAPRLCLYDHMRPLCASGRTAFVKAVFDCLLMDACQTPGDPSGGQACVQAAISAAATANDHAAGAAICACESGTSTEPGCAMMEPTYSMGNVMLMNDADVTAFTACLGTMACDENACLAATPLAAAFACPGL